MRLWIDDIEAATVDNDTFRTVLFTGENLQLTVMHIEPGSDVGWEAHSHLDQFLRLEAGRGRLDVGSTADAVDESHEVADDWAMIIPGGTWHNVVNTGDEPLKLYSIYAPPEHPDGTVHRTKDEAEAAEAEHEH